MSRVVKVLSIDGGGIRGIVPAMVLAELEKRAGPIAKLFDLIVGTSTGGIIALGLTAPGADGEPRFRAAELIDFYEEHGPRVFSRSVWHRTRAMGSLLEEKYPADALEDVLRHYFGETRLREARTDVMVTAYEIERRIPWFFRSRRAVDDPAYDFPMTVVARATSAAPTYFEPAQVETEEEVGYWALVDGGVYANNPAMCGLVESKVAYQADDVVLVSLGTGELTRRIPYEDAKDWGLLGWARPILDVVFDGVSDTVDYQVAQLLGAGPPRRYFRFQVTLDVGNDDLDDASATNLHALKLLASDLIGRQGQDLDELAERLTEEVPAAAV